MVDAKFGRTIKVIEIIMANAFIIIMIIEINVIKIAIIKFNSIEVSIC